MSEFIEVHWRDRPVLIEHRWIARERCDQPVIVFLHEGLGSVSMWKDFPDQLCNTVGCRGLVYSRPGYGRSTSPTALETWDVDFMHEQAHEVLPPLLQALGIDDKPWLFGHSDGASIALLYAAKHPQRVAGLVVLAPHIMVEDLTVKSIEKARQTYLDTDLRDKLGRHHEDPDRAFWRWSRIWLHPPFKQWSIEDEIGAITCPLLAVQGLEDEYGTLEQIHGIARRLPQAELLELPDCRHSPHRDQPQQLVGAVTAFVHRHHK